jgi:hypothetical protein
VPQSQSSLEDALKAFIQQSSQAIQELKNATMSNSQNLQELKQFTHQAFAKMEGQIDYLVAELNRIGEEELQSQLMAQGHCMIDEDDASHYCHEHVPDTTIQESKETVDNNEEEKEEHVESVEHMEQIETPSTPNQSNDKEVSTEAHSFITIPFETLHEPQDSILQCLKEPSCDKFVKDLCTQCHKSRNHLPNKIIRSKQVGYLRGRNILPECYQILKKKGRKGLVGHPNDRGRYGNF